MIDYNTVKFDYKDYTFGGKKVEATVILPEEDIRNMSPHDKEIVREKLVNLLVDDILNRGLVNFVQHPLDPISFNRRVTATMCLTPNTEVKVLRTLEREGII